MQRERNNKEKMEQKKEGKKNELKKGNKMKTR